MCQLGAARLNATTRAPITQCMNPSTDPDEVEFVGDLPTYSALGLTAMPAPASEKGYCEGLVAAEVGGLTGVIVGMRDLRAAGVVAELAPGETCLHSTGDGYESRVFCKDKIVAIVIGDDTAFILDKTSKTATLNVGGAALQVSENGITMASPDGTGIEITNGVIKVLGSQVYLGNSATGLEYLPVAGTVVPGPPPDTTVSPSLGVLCAAPLP